MCCLFQEKGYCQICRHSVIKGTAACTLSIKLCSFFQTQINQTSGKPSLITLIHNDFSPTKLQHPSLTHTAQQYLNVSLLRPIYSVLFNQQNGKIFKGRDQTLFCFSYSPGYLVMGICWRIHWIKCHVITHFGIQMTLIELGEIVTQRGKRDLFFSRTGQTIWINSDQWAFIT